MSREPSRVVNIYANGTKASENKISLAFLYFVKLILCQKSPSLLSQDFKMEEKLNMENEKIKYLIDIGFKNITCNFNYSDIWDDNSLNVLKQQYREISNIYYNEFKRKNYIRIYPLDTKMYFHIHEKKCSNSCNANRIAVNTDGTFYPCIQFVGDKRFEIGNYIDGIDSQKRKEIISKRLTSKVVCDECALKDRCIYKCGCARIITTNDVVEVSPLICETERIYIEEADNLANRLYKDFKDTFIALNY